LVARCDRTAKATGSNPVLSIFYRKIKNPAAIMVESMVLQESAGSNMTEMSAVAHDLIEGVELED
jgi:hypothetical protein